MHTVHGFDIVSYFFVQASLLILVISTEYTDVLVFPVPSFIHGFESLFQDADFNVCSKLCPWVRICSVRSLLSGRDFESYRWPQNLVTSSFCVSPTYIRSQTLHLAAYTISDVRHVPLAATFTSCPDFVFCKTSLLLISLQIEHPPQGSVGPLLF